MAHVYEIDDGGEVYWWAADSEQHAEQLHRKHVTEPSGEAHEEPVEAVLCDRGRPLTIDDETFRCDVWAERTKDCKVPMVGTTAF